MNKSKLLKSVLGTVLFLAIVVVMIVVYKNYSALDPSNKGDKTISIQVVIPDESTKDFTYSTDEDYLGPVLITEKLVEGSEGQYGFFMTAVDGRAADDSKQEWWCLTKETEAVFTGIDLTPIADGDKYELTLMTGY